MKNFKKMVAVLSAAAITAASMASISVSAEVEATDEPPYTAWLCVQAGATQQWAPDDATSEPATITGEGGSYTVSATIPEGGGSATIECMILSTNINAYAFVQEGKDPWVDGTAKIEIDSITIEHTDGSTLDLDYTGPSDGAFSKENDGVSLRINIYNVWGNDIKDIPTEPEGGLADGDKILVNFTVSGLTPPPAAALGDVDGNGEYEINDAFLALMECSNVSAGSDPTFDEEKMACADVDGDGTIAINDAFLILSYTSLLSAGDTTAPEDFFPAAKN